MSGFFSQFDAFQSTSRTSPSVDRLNARHCAIIEQNRAALEGRRVLDIASHDGRWSFAALAAGASHVTGIEARPHLIENTHSTFRRYGVSTSRYEFIRGDAFETLSRGDLRVDTVLCLGFLYHTIRHAELLDLISRTGADHLVVDTEVVPGPHRPVLGANPDPRLVFGNALAVELLKDRVEEESMACADSLTRDGQTLVARPSRAALQFMLRHFGYESEEFDWPGLLGGLPPSVVAGSLTDYAEGWRSTFRCWQP